MKTVEFVPRSVGLLICYSTQIAKTKTKQQQNEAAILRLSALTHHRATISFDMHLNSGVLVIVSKCP